MVCCIWKNGAVLIKEIMITVRFGKTLLGLIFFEYIIGVLVCVALVLLLVTLFALTGNFRYFTSFKKKLKGKQQTIPIKQNTDCRGRDVTCEIPKFTMKLW